MSKQCFVAVGVDLSSTSKPSEKAAASRQDIYAGIFVPSNIFKALLKQVHSQFLLLSEQLAAVPALANLGSLFKSSQLPIELTESETEYNVRCVKHTFPNHVVFQVRAAHPCFVCFLLEIFSDCDVSFSLTAPTR